MLGSSHFGRTSGILLVSFPLLINVFKLGGSSPSTRDGRTLGFLGFGEVLLRLFRIFALGQWQAGLDQSVGRSENWPSKSTVTEESEPSTS